MPRPKISLVGQKFNKLLVIEELPDKVNGHRYFKYQCDCGNFGTAAYSHLKGLRQKTCGCSHYRTWENSPFFEGVGKISFSWWRSHVLREPKGQKHLVEVTIEQAWNLFQKQKEKCALSGLPLSFGNTTNRNTASLDRIDSTKGYSLDNIQWVHKHINLMKRNHSDSYFIELCTKVVNHNYGT